MKVALKVVMMVGLKADSKVVRMAVKMVEQMVAMTVDW
jgi:hypothetical protein